MDQVRKGFVVGSIFELHKHTQGSALVFDDVLFFFWVGEEPTSILMNTHLLQPVPAQVWACHCKVSNAAQSTAPEAGEAVSEGCQKIYQFYGHQCPNQQDLEGWCQSGTSLNLFVQWQINVAMKIEVQIRQ